MDIEREIERLVAQIPPGRVSSFADIAEALGDARAAMATFRILRELSIGGSHRVLRTTGEIPFPGARAMLRREGLAVVGDRVKDFERVRWREFRGPRTLALLRDEQRRLAAEGDFTDRAGNPERIAGFDVAYDGDTAIAAAVVMDDDGDDVLQEVAFETRPEFPYIPGYLAYREFPAIESCFRRLDPPPDLLMIDGHGVLHPARCGIACVAGVRLDRPAIGVAKSLLVGLVGEVPREPGGWTDVRIDGERLGAALRSGRSRRLIYLSVGHRVSLSAAVRITKRLCKTRIPEPLRRADLLSKNEKRKWKKKRIEF